MTYDLITMGEVLMRLSPAGGFPMSQSDLLERYFGGSEMNVAAAAAAMGLSAAVVTQLPQNSLGTLARQFMRRVGISDAYCMEDARSNARLGIYYYEPGSFPAVPHVIYDREGSSMRTMTKKALPEAAFDNARCFHISGITLGLGGSCREAAFEAVRRFREHKAWISFDVNYRMNLWSGEEAKACIEKILPMVDIFFCSEDTMRLTFGKTGTLEEMLLSFAQEYPMSIIAATQRTVHRPSCHSFKSAVYNCKSQAFISEARGYERIEVTDRIGSGDAFVGGFLAGLLKGENIFGEAAVFNAMNWGNTCAALKLGMKGDVLHTQAEEVFDVIDRHYKRNLTEMKR